MRGEPVPPFPPNNRFSPDRILFEPGLCHRPSSTLPNPQHPCYAFGPSLTLTLTSYHFLLPPREPPFVGAIVCRVSKSFLRVAQLELFAMRKEMDELVHLANYACFREFPHLLTTSTSSTTPSSSSSSSSSSSTSSSTASNSLSAAELQQPGPARRYNNSGLILRRRLTIVVIAFIQPLSIIPILLHPFTNPCPYLPLLSLGMWRCFVVPSRATPVSSHNGSEWDTPKVRHDLFHYCFYYYLHYYNIPALIPQWLRVGYTQGMT